MLKHSHNCTLIVKTFVTELLDDRLDARLDQFEDTWFHLGQKLLSDLICVSLRRSQCRIVSVYLRVRIYKERGSLLCSAIEYFMVRVTLSSLMLDVTRVILRAIVQMIVVYDHLEAIEGLSRSSTDSDSVW